MSDQQQMDTSNAAAAVNTDNSEQNGKISKEESNKKQRRRDVAKGMEALRELFREKERWESIKEVEVGMQRHGFMKSASTFSRWLKDIGARHTGEGWVLDQKQVYKDCLSELHNLFEATKFDLPVFYTQGIRIAVLSTQLNYNRLIAQKIYEAFDEVKSVICPNDYDIVIIYKVKRNKSYNQDDGNPANTNGRKYIESQFIKKISDMIREVKNKTAKKTK